MQIPLRSLGKLLCLAERAEHERMGNTKTTAEEIAASRRKFEAKTTGTFEDHSAERDIFLFLQALSNEEKRDVAALFCLGRHAADDFETLRANPGLTLEDIPYHLSDKRDLERSLIEGIKRLSR